MNSIQNLVVINNSNRLPRFKNYKIYPTDECDICNNIDIIETCPLNNCNTNMCSECWHKIMTEFDRKCPTCRRIIPEKQLSCCEKIENTIVNDVCHYHIRSAILPFLSLAVLLLLLSVISWAMYGFSDYLWDRFFVFMLFALSAIFLFLIFFCVLDLLCKCCK